jgi:hypothetical protein
LRASGGLPDNDEARFLFLFPPEQPLALAFAPEADHDVPACDAAAVESEGNFVVGPFVQDVIARIPDLDGPGAVFACRYRPLEVAEVDVIVNLDGQPANACVCKTCECNETNLSRRAIIIYG